MSETTSPHIESNVPIDHRLGIGIVATDASLKLDMRDNIHTDEISHYREFIGRSKEWITDDVDEGRLKQTRFSEPSDRFYHIDISDNPIEPDFPLGDLACIVQVGKREAYIWRQIDGAQTQYVVTDESFDIGEDGSFEGWWVPLEVGHNLSLSSNIGDDNEGKLDLSLSEYNGEYELAVRNRGGVPARVYRAETSDEAEAEAEKQRLADQRRIQLEQEEKRRQWLESQKFDNYVDFTNYDTFLTTATKQYLGTPERTHSNAKDPGVKYTEVHVNADGDTYIIPAPRAMRPYGATVNGHHSIVDELRAYEGYDEFPNYMHFVNKLKIDTDTIRSKGYIKIDDDGKTILALNQNRGNADQRSDFKWLKDASEAAKKAGIDRVVLNEYGTKEVLELNLDAETETRVIYDPTYEPFHGSDLASSSLTVGVLEVISIEDTKTVKVGHDITANVKDIQKIRIEGSEADLQLHKPLYKRIEQRREGFTDTEFPIEVEFDGAMLNLAVTYQYDSDYDEVGVSFRYKTQPPDSFAVVQDNIVKKLIDNFASQHRETKTIIGSLSTSIGESGLPEMTPIEVVNPYSR